MTTAAIAANGLTKQFGRHVAVNAMSLEVAPGEVVGLLGPNGAGKTTTVKMLLGLVTPTAGTATLFGVPVADPAARRKVGYLPEHFRFPDWLTGRELVDFHGRLAGLNATQCRARVGEVLARVGLAGREDTRLKTYSKGMQQRAGLAQALVAEPELVLLDEPTSALDPLGRRDVRDLIRELRAAGTAVLLNSHLLSEVEQVCDRVIIVDHGQVIRAGRLDEIGGGAVEIRVTLDRVDSAARAVVAAHGEVIAADDTSMVVVTDTTLVAPALAADLIAAGYALHALVPTVRSLEDVFIGLVTETPG